jgi:hypothetical protein
VHAVGHGRDGVQYGRPRTEVSTGSFVLPERCIPNVLVEVVARRQPRLR